MIPGAYSTVTVGRRFGRLVVIGPVVRTGDDPNRYQYNCRCACDCGNYSYPRVGNLLGSTRSCGCLQQDAGRAWHRKNQRFFRARLEDVVEKTFESSIADEIAESEHYVRWMARAGHFGVGADRGRDDADAGLESAALRDAEKPTQKCYDCKHHGEVPSDHSEARRLWNRLASRRQRSKEPTAPDETSVPLPSNEMSYSVWLADLVAKTGA